MRDRPRGLPVIRPTLRASTRRLPSSSSGRRCRVLPQQPASQPVVPALERCPRGPRYSAERVSRRSMNAGHPAVTRCRPRRACVEATLTGAAASTSRAGTREPSATSRSAIASRTEVREALTELDSVCPSRAEALEVRPDLDPMHSSLAEACETCAEPDPIRTSADRSPPGTRRVDAGGSRDSFLTA